MIILESLLFFFDFAEMIDMYSVLGLMSGTSLDGLDVAHCIFTHENGKWKFSVKKANTFPYSLYWRDRLSKAESLSGLDLMLLHNDLGVYFGNCCKTFLNDKIDNIDIISSHGHTIFHQPDKRLTLQIANGASVAAVSGITTVCDFRNLDVALGGQGAPLVPIGDRFLFGEYDYCLNLGGFSNISYETSEGRIAYDICPVNIVINELVKILGLPMDKNGLIGRSGKINYSLLEELDNVDFYHQIGPKSLGKEWVFEEIFPVLNKYPILLEDKLATFYQHITNQIKVSLGDAKNKKMLVTGGGAHNQFLIELFKKRLPVECVLPDDLIIDFKEAIVFAFLGVLRMRGEINCLHKVTGSRSDNSGGVVFYPPGENKKGI